MQSLEQQLLNHLQNQGWDSWTVEHGHGGEFILGEFSITPDFMADTSVLVFDGSMDLASHGYSTYSNDSSRFTSQHGRPDSLHDSESLSAAMTPLVPGRYATPSLAYVNDENLGETSYEGWLYLVEMAQE